MSTWFEGGSERTARCPYCSAWLWNPPVPGVNEECPKCGATIGRDDEGYKVRLVVVESPVDTEPSLTEDEAKEKWKRDHEARSDELKPSGLAGEMDTHPLRRCKYCNGVVYTEDSSYCSYCGARLQIGENDFAEEEQSSQDLSEQGASQRDDRCMVCNRELTPDQDIVFCPYCGSVAHRPHLVQWVHEGNPCPRCRASLDEVRLQR